MCQNRNADKMTGFSIIKQYREAFPEQALQSLCDNDILSFFFLTKTFYSIQLLILIVGEG
jgi:hypothetical protein